MIGESYGDIIHPMFWKSLGCWKCGLKDYPSYFFRLYWILCLFLHGPWLHAEEHLVGDLNNAPTYIGSTAQ